MRNPDKYPWQKTVKTVSLPKLLQKTVGIFNKYIRLRDRDQGCISCGKKNIPLEAGHYRSAGHYSATRFNEINVNGQCKHCNCFLHGNLIDYRIGLVKKYGEKAVQELEEYSHIHRVWKWHPLELEAIIEDCKKKIKNNQTKF